MSLSIDNSMLDYVKMMYLDRLSGQSDNDRVKLVTGLTCISVKISYPKSSTEV
jgi:hypothetical protein